MTTIVPEATVHSAQGMDISNFQGVEPPSFWTGFQFGFAKATESTNFSDGTFAGNWANMKKVGIHRGAYHFFHPSVDPRAQAQFFVNAVKRNGLEPGDMLVADVEITSGLFRRLFRVSHKPFTFRNNLPVKPASSSLVNTNAKIFLDTVKSLVPASNPVLVYTDLSVGSVLVSCTGYPLWIAFPSSAAPGNVSPWRHWTFWQWGQTGVDRDAFDGTAADLQNWLNGFVSPPPTGPFKHNITSPVSVAALAAGRNESVAKFFDHQAPYFTAADAAATVIEKGVYYTISP